MRDLVKRLQEATGPDHYQCTRCGRVIHPFECPNRRVPVSCDMDGGTFAPRWYFPFKATERIFAEVLA
jgi:hypothetical protein